MLRRRFVAAAAAAFLTLTIAGRAQAPQRVMYVTALDSSGAPVEFLTPEDITIREDRNAREILDVTPAADPMELVLLVDNSQAAEPYIRDYRQALPAFIQAIADDATEARHQISIVTLADRPTVNTNYTLDLKAVATSAERLFSMPGSGSYLLDGIVEVCRGITRRTAVRPVIVAVSTEGPEMSNRSYPAVIEPLRATGAAFHVVTIGRPLNNNQDRSIVLDLGTKNSGGSFNTVLISTGLTAKMKALANELTHQFKVTYARPESLIPPEQITVAAARSGLTVRGTPARDVRNLRER